MTSKLTYPHRSEAATSTPRRSGARHLYRTRPVKRLVMPQLTSATSLPLWTMLLHSRSHKKFLADFLQRAALVLQDSSLEVDSFAVCVWTRATAQLSLPEDTIQDDEKGRIVVYRRPQGAIGSITPWNWPMMNAVWHIMLAIRAGCTVIVQPFLSLPLDPPACRHHERGFASRRGQRCHRLRRPGAYLAGHPGVDKIVFTGSIQTGKKIMSGAAASLKRLSLWSLGAMMPGLFFPARRSSPCTAASGNAVGETWLQEATAGKDVVRLGIADPRDQSAQSEKRWNPLSHHALSVSDAHSLCRRSSRRSL